MAGLFVSFPSYDSHYQPEPWYTDGDHHTIHYAYRGEADSVTVYEPEQAAIPGGLRRLIREMESQWQHMMHSRR